MEQPELVVQEPTLSPSRAESSPVEDGHKEHAQLNDETRPKPQHGHSDSMVTVRLSNANRDEDEGSDSMPTTPIAATHDTTTKNTTTTNTTTMPSESESAPKGDSARPTSTATTSTVGSSGASNSTTDNDEDTISPRSSSIMSEETPLSGRSQDTSDPAEVEPTPNSARVRSISFASSKSSSSNNVDWEKLDKNEKEEEHTEWTDESTAFLLARLEQENNALAIDPKSSLASPRERKGSRPPSMQQLKKMVAEPTESHLRYSTLPSPPPMTELEFWSALVRDYPSTAQRLPTLTANKIRQGIPPPLRGVVWQSIAGARDSALEEQFDKLLLESSPYEQLIHKDIGRSFPGVDMFRDPEGEGQQMLSRVLKAYSLYDQDIGYCQGLGFVVGPLLMQMGDKEAFCTLVRLMEQYGLRSCFLPNLTGLHLRIYQFQHFLSSFLPNVTAHLEKLNVEPLYITQWFLSFFGVTCPIPMLIRLYDVILTEGASETLMRVALSVMRRNEKKILAAKEFEEVMQLLLSRSLWDPYNYNADTLMADFCHWTGLVTRESLAELETAFKESQSPVVRKPSVHTAAQRFLGRLWNSSGALMSPRTPFVSSPLAPPPTSNPLRRTPSKQSMASTLNSVDGSDTSVNSATTDATTVSRQQSADWAPPKTTVISNPPPGKASNKDKDFHTQIEDLLTALNNMQKENNLLKEQLQREREERDEDRQLVTKVVERLRGQTTLDSVPEEKDTAAPEPTISGPTTLEKAAIDLEDQFTPPIQRGSVMMQTKQQLREESARWKSLYQEEVSRSTDLSNQLSDRDRELVSHRDNLREARSRIQDGFKEKHRLEKVNKDLRSQKPAIDISKTGNISPDTASPSPNGLREFKLGRTSTMSANLQPNLSKRVSSLSSHSIMTDEDSSKTPEDALLVELANAKAAEATARQELEEVKTKLESFRKLLSGTAISASTTPTSTTRLTPSPMPGHSHSHSTTKVAQLKEEQAAATSAASPMATVGGFFSGWGKRSASSNNS